MFFFFQAEDGIRDHCVTGVQTCALPISPAAGFGSARASSRERRLRIVKLEDAHAQRGGPYPAQSRLRRGVRVRAVGLFGASAISEDGQGAATSCIGGKMAGED